MRAVKVVDLLQHLIHDIFLLDTPVSPESKQVLERDFQRREVIPFAVPADTKQFLHPVAAHESLKPVASDAFFAKASDLIFRMFVNSVTG